MQIEKMYKYNEVLIYKNELPNIQISDLAILLFQVQKSIYHDFEN